MNTRLPIQTGKASMPRRGCLAFLAIVCWGAMTTTQAQSSAPQPPQLTPPKNQGDSWRLVTTAPVPLSLRTRRLVPGENPGNTWRVEEKSVAWEPRRTAVVICDMWDRHWCQGATARVGEMAPRMNQLIAKLRARGVLVIHCPSDTMKFYEGQPGRVLAQSAPQVDLGPILEQNKGRAPAVEPALPIDDADGGCDDTPTCPQGGPWKRQIATLEVKAGDAITDGVEAFQLMRARGITNVLIMGVHQNMCVLGRAFAIRQMVRLGQNVLLVRDLTDSMYNSRSKPFVNHFAGNDLVCQHIEKYWCPTVTSDQILGGQPFRFKADVRQP